VAWTIERLARLKFNGRPGGRYTALARLLEVEAMMAGIITKWSLWRSLDSADVPALASFDFRALGDRAQSQYNRLRPHHDEAARFALDVAAGAEGPGTLPILPGARSIMMRVLHRDPGDEPARLVLSGGPPIRDLALAQGSTAAALGQVAQALTGSIRTFLEWSAVTSAARNAFHAEAPQMAQGVQGDPDRTVTGTNPPAGTPTKAGTGVLIITKN
jgi:hypothetical protein